MLHVRSVTGGRSAAVLVIPPVTQSTPDRSSDAAVPELGVSSEDGAAPRRPSLAAVPRSVLLALGRSPRAVRIAGRFGPRLGARRFVAGETLGDCLEVLRAKRRDGILGYAILLGEGFDDAGRVESTVAAHRAAVGRIGAERLGATMSIKLTQLGLVQDEELAFRSAREIVAAAGEVDMFVRMDMEHSRFVDATLRIYRRLRDEGLDNTGVALQAYLRRTERDLRELLELRPNIRLVKGAYLESPTVAYTRKRDVDASYRSLLETALSGGGFTAIATHDDRMVEHAESVLGDARDRSHYEFQLLYGVREQLQSELARRGHQVRLCIPFGEDWFVYFTRRLAERPANVAFVLRSILRG